MPSGRGPHAVRSSSAPARCGQFQPARPRVPARRRPIRRRPAGRRAPPAAARRQPGRRRKSGQPQTGRLVAGRRPERPVSRSSAAKSSSVRGCVPRWRRSPPKSSTCRSTASPWSRVTPPRAPDEGYTAGSKTLQVGGVNVRKAAADGPPGAARDGQRADLVSARSLQSPMESISVQSDPAQSVSYADLIGGQRFQRTDRRPDAAQRPEPYTIVGQSIQRVDSARQSHRRRELRPGPAPAGHAARSRRSIRRCGRHAGGRRRELGRRHPRPGQSRPEWHRSSAWWPSVRSRPSRPPSVEGHLECGRALPERRWAGRLPAPANDRGQGAGLFG